MYGLAFACILVSLYCSLLHSRHLSGIIREFPGYGTNLRVSRMGRQISQPCSQGFVWKALGARLQISRTKTTLNLLKTKQNGFLYLSLKS